MPSEPPDRPPLRLAGILAAARELVRADGIDGLSLRRLAGRLDVTAPALYAHVTDKDDLLRRVARDAAARLAVRLVEVAAEDDVGDGAGGDGGHLVAVAAALVAHGDEEPALHALLGRFPTELEGPGGPLAVLADAAAAAGVADAELAALALWASTAGAAALVAARAEEGAPLPPQQAIDLGQAIVDHLATGFLAGRR